MIFLIIVYSSKSGSSEKYARSFSDISGYPVYSVKDNYPKDQPIVFFGWVKGPSIVGIRGIDRSMLHAVCAVGLDTSDRFNSQKISDSNNISVPIYYIRGWIVRDRIGFMDKLILSLVAATMKIRGLNSFNEPIFKAMLYGGSFYDDSQLDSLSRFCSSNL